MGAMVEPPFWLRGAPATPPQQIKKWVQRTAPIAKYFPQLALVAFWFVGLLASLGRLTIKPTVLLHLFACDRKIRFSRSRICGSRRFWLLRFGFSGFLVPADVVSFAHILSFQYAVIGCRNGETITAVVRRLPFERHATVSDIVPNGSALGDGLSCSFVQRLLLSARDGRDRGLEHDVCGGKIFSCINLIPI